MYKLKALNRAWVSFDPHQKLGAWYEVWMQQNWDADRTTSVPTSVLRLFSVDVVDKDQDSQSGIGSLLFLLPRCKSKLEELKDQDM